jgi:hypothetical protein
MREPRCTELRAKKSNSAEVVVLVRKGSAHTLCNKNGKDPAEKEQKLG